MLRLLAGLARWTLAGLVAFWLLLGATAGVLHGLIVPRIGDYRGKLEQLAAQALGVPVHIGSVAAFSDGLVPSLELREVQLLDSQGQTALRLPRVLVAISARSLWRQGVEQIVVESPELQLRRLADGRWEVAGLLQRDDRADDGAALEWVLNQPEIAVRGGTLRWVDELRGTPQQQLHAVDLVLRSGHWRHALRLDAQLDPAQGGGAVQVLGQLREPLLPTGRKPWERWQGQWYAQGRLQQLPALPWPQEWGVNQVQAAGDFRAWADVRKGSLAGLTVDLQLPQAEVQWTGAQPAPLALRDVAGRLDLQALDGGWQAKATGWTFTLDDGRRWPQSALTVRWPQAGSPSPHALETNFLDLGLVQALAARLPLPEAAAAPLRRWALQGQARDLRVHWQPAAPNQSLRYRAQGQVQALQLLDTQEEAERLPGVQGLSASFTLDQQGGSADVSMRQGALEFPGIFEEPRIPVDRLQAQLRWSQDANGRWSVQLPQAQFANADAQGQFKAQWQMGADAAQRLPGELNLEGVLTRANGARVHRYLPLEVPADARHYVRDSVRSGQAAGVRFKVQGPLAEFPFDHHPAGVFQITAPVRDVVYDYAPPSVRAPGEAPWPLISRLAGELVFDKSGMQVRNAQGLFGEGGKVPMEGIQASIPDLSYPVLKVKGHGKAALPAWLEVVARSPLAALTEHALDQASSAGAATLDLDLTLPIDHLDQARVQGTVGLQGNRLRLRPDVPELQDARGAVHFSEQGFEIAEVQAQSMGGKVRVNGGMKLGKGAPVLDVRARGRATAEGMRSDGFLAPVAALAQHAAGAADYDVQVGLLRGLPQITVRSSLQGMAVQLPAPLGKPAEGAVPLQITQRLTPQAAASAQAPLRDMLQVHVQDRAALTYVFDQGGQASQVVAGWLELGGNVGAAGAWSAGLESSREVQAHVQLDSLDLDAWLALWPKEGKAETGAAPATAMQEYLPQNLALRTGSLRLHGRTLYDVVAGLSHADAVWRGNVQSRQLGGYVEYREPGAANPQGMVFARLSHLLLPEGAGEQADNLLQSQPRQMPALDIVVKEFALAGRELGSLAVQARNMRRDGSAQWVLDHLDLTMPEAVLTTSGTWGGPDVLRRRTQLRFTLQLKDSGALLGRLAMPGVVRGGKGLLEGQLTWRGAPIAPDWRSMSGQLHLDVGQGQFLKAEPGLAKLLSVLSLQSLPRRIGLDFRDVFSSGFAFDFVRGDVAVTQGVARTNNLQMKGVNAAVLMEGQASLVDETQQLRVVVVPEINAMTASLVASAINPVIGLGSFLAQAVLRGPLIAAATREFEVTGSWVDPQVKVVSKRATLPDTAATAQSPPDPSATQESMP
ncbi:YhdP family protein [Comamonas sp. GB3 AK4-5]|uniref:YhdP family protein n=1 Tax=Comamonas sp. GB3 AK4-5 TaxID=3231487 RepID=UPI00351F3633